MGVLIKRNWRLALLSFFTLIGCVTLAMFFSTNLKTLKWTIEFITEFEREYILNRPPLTDPYRVQQYAGLLRDRIKYIFLAISSITTVATLILLNIYMWRTHLKLLPLTSARSEELKELRREQRKKKLEEELEKLK